MPITNSWFNAKALTGGTAWALDAIPATQLAQGDVALTVHEGVLYVHEWDEASTSAESLPGVVQSDSGGVGRWLLRKVFPSGFLSAIEALSGAGLVNKTGAASGELVEVSTFAKTLLDDVSASAAQSTLGVAVGEQVQAYNVALAQINYAEATTGDIVSGTTGNLDLNVPDGAVIFGVALRVDTAITGATSWAAAFTGGNTDAICTAQAVAKNTKHTATFDTLKPVSGAVADIEITGSGGDFTAGKITARVYFLSVAALPDAA